METGITRCRSIGLGALLLSVALGFFPGPISAPAAAVDISNTVPRRDSEGSILDAHDGRLIRFGKRYFLYGTVYGTTTGVAPTNYFRSYSSPDLSRWTRHDTLLKGLPVRMQYRPHVVRNRKTGKYVLFYNWYSSGFDTGMIGAATSDRPDGPFTVMNEALNLAKAQPGDFNVMVDYDNTAYIIYTSIADGHTEHLERLSEDYLNSAGQPSVQISSGGCTEAASMFKRSGVYYITFGECCCFCSQGAGVRVLKASHPMGPYVFASDINRDAGGQLIIPAQSTMVAEIPLRRGTGYLYMGDRWFSAPDGDGKLHKCFDTYSGTKGHDFQYWSQPLEFDQAGNIGNLGRFENSFSLDLRGPDDEYNVAAHENGGMATASTSLGADFLPAAAINGERNGAGWEHRGGWNDNTAGFFPDYLEVGFDTLKSIREISVTTLQDGYLAPLEVTDAMTFSKYGLVDFSVEYWTGSAWKAVTGGVVTGNDKVRVTLPIEPGTLTTDRIRVAARKSADGVHSRIVEIEAWGKDAATIPTGVPAKPKHGRVGGYRAGVSGQGLLRSTASGLPVSTPAYGSGRNLQGRFVPSLQRPLE